MRTLNRLLIVEEAGFSPAKLAHLLWFKRKKKDRFNQTLIIHVKNPPPHPPPTPIFIQNFILNFYQILLEDTSENKDIKWTHYFEFIIYFFLEFSAEDKFTTKISVS